MTIDYTLMHPARHSRGLAAAFAVAFLFAAIAASAATCPTGLAATNPTPIADFVINANNTVMHTPTALMWKRCHEGLIGSACTTGTVSYVRWSDALTAAKQRWPGRCPR